MNELTKEELEKKIAYLEEKIDELLADYHSMKSVNSNGLTEIDNIKRYVIELEKCLYENVRRT